MQVQRLRARNLDRKVGCDSPLHLNHGRYTGNNDIPSLAGSSPIVTVSDIESPLFSLTADRSSASSGDGAFSGPSVVSVHVYERRSRCVDSRLRFGCFVAALQRSVYDKGSHRDDVAFLPVFDVRPDT